MAKMKIVIVGDASSAKRAFSEVGGGAQSMAGRLGGALGSVAKTAAFAAGAAGIGAIAVSLKQGYDEWKQSALVTAQTEAVLKSTAHSAGVTAKQVDELSRSLMQKSGVDDEAIKSGENMLLTFCLEESAEALTIDRGWVRHDELRTGDWILGYDPEDDCAKWESVDSVHRFGVDGELTRWKSKQIDVATTAAHRWWTTGRTTDRSGGEPVTAMQEHRFRTTEEVSGHQFAVKIGGGHPGGFAENAVYSDELVELLGWVVTEGWANWLRPSTPQQNGCGFSQSETSNPENVAHIRGLVQRLRSQGHEISESRQERVRGQHSGVAVALTRDTAQIAWTFGKSLGKAIKAMAPEKKLRPEFLSQLTADQASLLLATLIAGDGHTNGKGHRQYIQKDSEQRGMIAMLCAMLGIRTTELGRGDSILLCDTNYAWGHQVNATQERYKGVVWCPHLRTGIFMARCNGRTFWTGNTNIRNEAGKGNDIFDQTTKATLDLSVAMGKDMKGASILVGKALNDPIRGLTALTRVGVTFSEGQRKQIKAMVASGNTMGAQKIILKELNKEFGGSAEAMGKTLPGKIKIAQENFKNLAGTLFTKLVPALNNVLAWVNDHWPQIERTMSAVFTGIAWAIQNVLAPALRGMVTGIRFVVDWTRAHWAQISKVIQTVLAAVKAVVMGWVLLIQAIWRNFGDTLTSIARAAWSYIKGTVKNGIEVVRGIVNVIAGLIKGDWGRVWEGIRQIVGGTLKQIWNTLRTYISILGAVAAKLGMVLWNGLKFGASAVLNWIIDKINWVIGKINAVADKIPGVPSIPTIPGVGGGSPGSSPPFAIPGGGGPVGSPSQAAIRRAGAGASVNVGPITVNGTADAQFARVLAAELATQMRGGRVTEFTSAVAAV